MPNGSTAGEESRQRESGTISGDFPVHISRWSGLRAQMTFTTILVMLAVVVFILFIRLGIFLVLREPLRDLTVAMFIAIVVPAWTPIIGAVTGLAAARNPVKRIQRLVLATNIVAQGDYGERVAVSRRDEIGQLEHHFNEMAEQLEAGTMERQILIEQNARLAERARISRDLHDSVKQQLFAIAMQVGVALSQIETGDVGTRASVDLRKHLEEADTLIAVAQQDLTALIHQWHPSALRDHDLGSALDAFTTEWSRRHDIPVELLLADTSQCLTDGVDDALWHIAQEALSNVARHAQARHVSMRLDVTSQQVTLVVADDGRGFVSTAPAAGVGLRSMRERLVALGGSLSIDSSQGRGTRITAQCPVAPGSSAVRGPTAEAESLRA